MTISAALQISVTKIKPYYSYDLIYDTIASPFNP